MRGVTRFTVMLFAYIVAIGTATAAFVTLLYVAQSDLLVRVELFSDVTPRSQIFSSFVVILAGIAAAVSTLLPVLVALLFAETCGSQSARYFLVWGLTAWAGPWFLFGLASWIENGRAFEMLAYDTAAFATGGLIWGIVYWIIAGRTSGDWIDARQAK